MTDERDRFVSRLFAAVVTVVLLLFALQPFAWWIETEIEHHRRIEMIEATGEAARNALRNNNHD